MNLNKIYKNYLIQKAILFTKLSSQLKKNTELKKKRKHKNIMQEM